MKDYQEQTLANPSWIKRFSHKARFQRSLALISPRPGEKILDYGAGDGSLTAMLINLCPEAHYSVFEPTDELRRQANETLSQHGTKTVSMADISQAQDANFDVIVCQEVLEHLPDAIQSDALDQFSRLLAPGGRLIISVPVEIGLSSLFKNIVRVLVRQAHESSSSLNFLRALIGRTAKIPRIQRDGYIDSHLGFDYRILEKELGKRGWVVQRRLFSPLPLLGAVFNSQVFYCLKQP